MATKVNQETCMFLITDHKTEKKKINTKLSVGTTGVTAFFFTFKTFNVDRVFSIVEAFVPLQNPVFQH